MSRFQKLARMVVLLTAVGVPRAASGQAGVPTTGFDFTGVDAFWPLYTALRRGEEPTAVAWDAIFATPGYAALEARERRRVGLELAMRLAFAPARAVARDSALKTNTFTARATRHLMGIAAAHDSIERFRAVLRGSRVIDVARRRVAAFVPRGLADSVPPPPVALVFFLDDGRGYPTVIVADLLRLARAGPDTGYFAHEFYHSYRRRFTVSYRAPESADVGIQELLAYPVEEGMADQLDKVGYAELNDSAFASYMKRPGAPAYAPEYRANYARAKEWMAVVSRTLERAAARPDSATQIARAGRDSLPDSGRPLGAYMARTIDRLRGRDALIRSGGDEYQFWLYYETTARDAAREGVVLPRLSPGALALIRRLAQQYR